MAISYHNWTTDISFNQVYDHSQTGLELGSAWLEASHTQGLCVFFVGSNWDLEESSFNQVYDHSQTGRSQQFS